MDLRLMKLCMQSCRWEVEMIGTLVSNVYAQEDVSMNGIIQYAGAGNDRDPILFNIGGTIASAVRTEQLP